MPRKNKKYEPEFKIKVIEAKINNKLGYNETANKYYLTINVKGIFTLQWEELKTGKEYILKKVKKVFYKEKRGRKSTGSKPKLSSKIEEDLIAENQRLRMELEYLKKLEALVQERELRENHSSAST